MTDIMKTFLLIMGILLMCTSNNYHSQDIPSSNSAIVDTIGDKIVPDTTIYETSINLDKDNQIRKMNVLKDQTKEVYKASMKLNQAVVKQKQETEAKESWEYFKNNVVDKPQ